MKWEPDDDIQDAESHSDKETDELKAQACENGQTEWEVAALTAFLPDATGLNQPVVLCLRKHLTQENRARFEVTTCVDNLQYEGSEQEMRERFDRTVDQHQRLVQATGEEKARLAFEVERERTIESMLREDLVWACASDADEDDRSGGL